MNSILPKTAIALAFTACLMMGCASAPVENTVANSNVLAEIADCNETLSIVYSPINKVAPDGTILYDGENKEILAKLLEKSLELQKLNGCKK